MGRERQQGLAAAGGAEAGAGGEDALPQSPGLPGGPATEQIVLQVVIIIRLLLHKLSLLPNYYYKLNLHY